MNSAYPRKHSKFAASIAFILILTFLFSAAPLSIFSLGASDLPNYPTQNWHYEFRDDSAGRAGTGSVNKGARGVSLQREEIAFDGFESSAKIVRHFSSSNSANAARFGAADSVYGANWLLNYNQLLRWNADENRYEYLNSTGQIFYFAPSNGVAKDGVYHIYETTQDTVMLTGATLLLPENLANYTDFTALKLQNDARQELSFDALGRLAKVTASANSAALAQLQYVGNSLTQIEKITDNAGCEFRFTYENGLLREISGYKANGDAIWVGGPGEPPATPEPPPVVVSPEPETIQKIFNFTKLFSEIPHNLSGAASGGGSPAYTATDSELSARCEASLFAAASDSHAVIIFGGPNSGTVRPFNDVLEGWLNANYPGWSAYNLSLSATSRIKYVNNTLGNSSREYAYAGYSAVADSTTTFSTNNALGQWGDASTGGTWVQTMNNTALAALTQNTAAWRCAFNVSAHRAVNAPYRRCYLYPNSGDNFFRFQGTVTIPNPAWQPPYQPPTPPPEDNGARVLKMQYNYDGDALAGVNYPHGEIVNYAYNAQGLLTQASENGGAFIRYDYDAKENLTQLLLPNDTIDITVGADGQPVYTGTSGQAETIDCDEPGRVWDYIAAASVALNKDSFSLYIGQSETLAATILPVKATNKALIWESSAPDVAEVDADGKVTAKALGTASVTVKSAENEDLTATCAVTVSPVLVTGVTLNKSALRLFLNDTETLIATIVPDNATEKSVIWESNAPDIAEVDTNGKVTAKALGTASVTVKSAENESITAACAINVELGYVENITLSQTNLSLLIGAESTITATTTPDYAPNKTLAWTSSNPDVASVTSGKIIAIKAGNTVITAAATDGSGISASCTVTITNVAATGVTLNKTALTLLPGKSETLIATVAPPNATVKTVTWKSSNTAVATVDANGAVKAIAAGTTTITVTTTDGNKSASCVVSVPKVTLDKTGATLGIKQTQALAATVTGEPGTALTWKSGNTAVATVSATGVVTGVAAGTATITVTTTAGATAVCTATVKPLPTAIAVNYTSVAMGVGESYIYTVKPTTSDAIDTYTWKLTNLSPAGCLTVNASTGEVKAAAVGTGTLTATGTNSKLTAACNITVKAAPTSIKFDCGASVTLGVGETLKLTFTLDDTTKGSLRRWCTTSNSTVATTPSNVLTANAVGTATITVETFNGKKATLAVTVVPAPESIKLSIAAVTLGVGQTSTPTVTFTPTNASKTKSWSSSNTTIATVDANGKITAVKAGSATITVKSYNGKSDTCAVTVNPAPTAVSVPAFSLGLGQVYTPKPTLTPTNATTSYTWTSSDSTIAAVNATTGEITAKKLGSTKITVKTHNGKSAEFNVTVKKKPTGVTFIADGKEQLTYTIAPGAAVTLVSFLLPDTIPNQTDYAAKARAYSIISGAEFITRSGETITGVKGGEAKVRVTIYTGAYKDCTIIVKSDPTSITLSAKTATLAVGDTLTPTVSYAPVGKAREGVTWKSSNTAIATVDSAGKITAKGVGSATITATATYGGKADTCTVTVKAAPTAITMTKPKSTEATPIPTITIGKNESVTTAWTLTPSNAYDILSWQSGDSKTVSVTGAGVIKGLLVSKLDSAGKVVPTRVTVTTKNQVSPKSASFNVVVREVPTTANTTMNYPAATIGVGDSLTLAPKFADNAYSYARTWSTTSGADYITRSNGTVTGVKAGKAKIQVALYNGITATATVEVVAAPTAVKIKNGSKVLAEGETVAITRAASDVKLQLTANPALTSGLTWTSSDATIATVSTAGLVTAKKNGTATITLTAYNGKKATCKVAVTQVYTVTFNAQGGTIGTATTAAKTVTYAAKYVLPANPTRTGYTLKGWYTAASGGTKITTSTVVKITANQTLYAQWTINKYAVKFDAKGGSAVAAKSIAYNTAIGALPTPTRTGYTLKGWYTAASGGTKISSTTKITKAVTFYAQWTVKVATIDVSAYLRPVAKTGAGDPVPGAKFGAYREGLANPYHAACDFAYSNNTPVYAATGGYAYYYAYFWESTYELRVLNDDGTTFRYCEIKSTLSGLDNIANTRIRLERGDKIGVMITNTFNGCAMLHLEWYKNTATGSFNQSNSTTYDYVPVKPYGRRRDLLDPTPIFNLKQW